MISSLLNWIFKVFVLLIKAISLLYHLASATNFAVLLICCVIVFVLSRWFRLKQPILPEHLTIAIDGRRHQHDNQQYCCTNTNTAVVQWSPIANRAACLDNVENSQSAIEKCVEQTCQNILLDLDITRCGQLVILHKKTLHRLYNGASNGIDRSQWPACAQISTLKMDDLKTLNIAKNNPLGGEHPPESVLQFNDLMNLLGVHQKLNIFLLMSSSHHQIIANISRNFENNPERFKRIVICSRSPRVIYQLRKQNSQFICALWLDKVTKSGLPSILLNSPFFSFIYGLIYCNIIGVLTGISAVFINKHDFNAHIGQMWRELNIRPIVYTLNSPNEKRYYQQTLRTQYLTESLRSEPGNFVKKP